MAHQVRIGTHPIETLDAAPTKRIYQSIIADYDPNRAICELVDNALDAWRQNNCSSPLHVRLDLDAAQQSILIEDNAGGVPHKHLRTIISPGESRNLPSDPTIGYFGVGSKRAAVALAMDVTISTRAQKENGTRITYGDEWLEVDDNWDLPVYSAEGLAEGTTAIRLARLRHSVDDDAITRLRAHLSAVYGRYIAGARLVLELNSDPVEPAKIDEWAYPPTYPPRLTKITLPSAEGNIAVEILGGLMRTASPGTGDYGVFVYCNDRLIGSGLKTHEVGFLPGQAGKPHPAASLMRVVVSFAGPAASMPWNSSKSDVNVQHWAFKSVQRNVVDSVAYWAVLSRRLEGDWTNLVRPFDVGVIAEERQEAGKPTRSYLPKLPSKRPPRPSELFRDQNSALRKKPWTGGLIDALMAVDVILRTRKIEQRNRIAMILLDSTIEIAFKDYLVNESAHPYSDAALVKLFARRHDVQQEFAKYVKLPKSTWVKIDHYYHMRCKLVHERANAAISDEEVANQMEMVKVVLRKAFQLKLSSASD